MKKYLTFGQIVRREQQRRSVDAMKRYSIYSGKQVEKQKPRTPRRVRRTMLSKIQYASRVKAPSYVPSTKSYYKKTVSERRLISNFSKLKRRKKLNMPSQREIQRSIARFGKKVTIKKIKQSLLNAVTPVSMDSINAILSSWKEFEELQAWGASLRASGVTESSFRDMFQILYNSVLGDLYRNPDEYSYEEWSSLIHQELMNVTPQAERVSSSYEIESKTIKNYVDYIAKKY